MSQTKVVRGVATSVQSRNSATVVRYHSTDVVEFTPTTITLRSGGWQTTTTKLRINQASNQFNLGISLHQSKHEWFVTIQPKNGSESRTLPFEDGMVIDRATGLVVDVNP